ncbi:MAG: SDR family NAD(P)-dependent oxidoreductase [Planctomycetes bacterium]|nr:SDR family NAD(P)-dependent oxidoreductase [Planctomycetota bacterium]MBL7154246.1 SDR family NAD(P)-dependent oxidoreductase [Phycisphaerae bacterium]
MNLEDKVALVTGSAGNGMGRSIALTLAREGAKVAINYRTSKDAAQAIVNHIKNRKGCAIAVEADVFEADGCKNLVSATTEHFGPIDICVINPGAGWHSEPIDKLNSSAAIEDVVNEIAPLFHLMPLVLPQMYKQKWGRIIGIALLPPYDSPAYSYNAGKAARTQAMLRARDEAWRNGVTVNIIAPGPVPAIESLSEAVEQCDHGSAWESRADTSPQDIAEAVAFLCAGAGRFITGCVLPFLFR